MLKKKYSISNSILCISMSMSMKIIYQLLYGMRMCSMHVCRFLVAQLLYSS